MAGSDSRPRLVALFSHPLVNKGGQPLDALDTAGERAAPWRAFEESRAPVRVCFDIATTETLQNHLLHPDGCDWLHWSGHGDEPALAFEDGRGGVHAVYGDQLRDLVRAAAGEPLSLAFVSACHSEEIGRALVEAGVKHVVAVELEHRVLDTAATAFARGFYQALAGGRTVNKAFEAGRAAVRAAPLARTDREKIEEAAKFRLLPDDGEEHDVVLCEGIGEGKPEDQSKPPTPNNLPARRSDFVGRAWEIHRIVETLLAGDRLVTVRGAPGIGKTQAVIEGARWLAERRHFAEGIWFVDLRGAMSAEAIRAGIALALGMECENDEQLAALLRERDCLVALDNLEDPLREDRPGVRRLLSLLLNQAQKVKVLATSRVLIGGGVPAPERVETIPQFNLNDSAELFAASAGQPLRAKELAEDAEFLRIFELLGGHPLSLSIAAGHLATRSLREIREALEQAPDRVLEVPDISEEDEPHLTSVSRSINLSLGWLREAEPEAVRLFGILSLLPGGATAEALGAIVPFAWREPMDVLLRHSLVEREGDRWSLLPVVLIYAGRCLSEEDRERCGARAVEHFAGVYERGCDQFGRREPLITAGLLSLELPNALACMGNARLGTPVPRARLGCWGSRVCVLLSRLEEGATLGRLALGAARLGRIRPWEANALRALGHVLWRRDDLEGAQSRHEEALAIYREIGNRLGEANALWSLGHVVRQKDDLEGAQSRYEEALGIYRKIGARLGEANALDSLGEVLRRRGDLEGAEGRYEEALGIYREIGERLGEANAYLGLGRLRGAEGKQEAALVEFEKALAIYWEIGDRYSAALALLDTAEALYALGRREEARAAVEEAERIARGIGDEGMVGRTGEVRGRLGI